MEAEIVTPNGTAATAAASSGSIATEGMSPDSVSAPATPAPSVEAVLERILSSLDDDKAEGIVPIDLRGKSPIADWMVICSGRSSRQVTAISEHLVQNLKADLALRCRVEGKDQGDWVLIDCGDIVVHVFRPEIREFYQLEKIWLEPEELAAAGNAPVGSTSSGADVNP